MIRIDRTITIHRPVEEVFAYLYKVENGPRYVSGQQEAHKTSSGPLGVGTTFATSGRFPWLNRTHTITEFEPNRRLAWQTMSGARATTTWHLEPSGPSTRVTFSRVADPHGLSGLPDAVMQRLANGRVDQDLGTLKELLAVTRTPAATKGW
jgi:uncharacterized membrane protein